MEKSIKINRLLLVSLGVIDIGFLVYGFIYAFIGEEQMGLGFYAFVFLVSLALAAYPALLIYMGIRLKKYLATSIERVEFMLKLYIFFSILGLLILITNFDWLSFIVGLLTLIFVVYSLHSIRQIYSQRNLPPVQHERSRFNKITWQIFTGGTKFLVGISVFIFIIFGAIPFTLNTFWGKDIPPIDDSDLTLSKIEVPDGDNMFFVLNKITREMVSREPDMLEDPEWYLKTDSWDADFADEIFGQNKEIMNIWTQASEKEIYQVPYLADPDQYEINMPVVYLGSHRVAGRISSGYAVWLVHEGQNQQAMDEAVKTLKIGDAMINSQSDLINYLVGIALKNMGLDTIQEIAVKTEGEGFDRDKLLSDLKKYNHINESNSMFKIQYLVGKKFFSDMGKDTSENILDNPDNDDVFGTLSKNKFHYKPNMTISYEAQRARSYIKNMANYCDEPEEFSIPYEDPRPETIWDYPKLLFTENVIGKLLNDLAVLSWNDTVVKTCDLQTKHQQTLEMIKDTL